MVHRLSDAELLMLVTCELSLAGGVPGVHPEPGAGVVDALHQHQGQRARAAPGQDVLPELLLVARVLGHLEHLLDLVLEGEVEGLLGEVPDDAGQVPPPEAGHPLVEVGPGHAVPHPQVPRLQPPLLEQLALVLQQQLDPLYGRGARLGHGRRDARQREVFTEAQLGSGAGAG